MTSLSISLPLLLAALVPCLWDRDTLAVEAAGAPGLVEVLTGRFDRFPGRYYEMRLERVGAEIEAGDADLGLFDDAAVASDRLGRSGEAIEWMGRKRQRLSALAAPDAHHEYTYLANLGTFHAHRWLRAEEAERDRADLERARDLIASAIEKNPDAHFGRERYQLLAIEHLLDPEERVTQGFPQTLMRRMYESKGRKYGTVRLKDIGYGDATEGLAGLIHLGDAWRSPLIWATLQAVLKERNDAYLARLAALRVAEIVDDAPGSVPDFDRKDYLSYALAQLEDPDGVALDAWESRARASVQQWQASRRDYVLQRLNRGEHPDTHPNFWSDWRDEHPLPALDGVLTAEAWRRRFQMVRVAAMIILIAFCIVVIHRRMTRTVAAA